MKRKQQVKGQRLKVKETARDSRNGSGSIGCTGEGGHETRPYDDVVLVGAIPCGRPRSEETFHQVHA
jgi:hypothetical protein